MTKTCDRDRNDAIDAALPQRPARLSRRQALRAGAGTAALVAFNPELSAAANTRGSRLNLSFDEGWRFCRGDVAGAQAVAFDESSWRELDLPHDWRIEDLPGPTSDDGGATASPSTFAFEKTPFTDGTPPRAIGPFDVDADPKPDVDVTYPVIGHILMPGGRSQGYTVAGVGWYRKHFHVPAGVGGGERVQLRFDGVYQNADVWINGVHLGFHPNGYTSFAYDLTPHLNRSGQNVVAVRVDNRGKTSRWYSGSGIYRHTWLTLTGAVSIPLWGVHVTTPVVAQRHSQVQAEVQLTNAGPATQASVRLTVFDPGGRAVATRTTPVQPLGAGATLAHSAQIDLDGAALWSPQSPSLYRMQAEVLVGRKVVDAMSTTFGVRSLVFNGAQGFLLNGQPIKIQGGNIHQDHGPIGTVALARAEERQIEIMKASGFNAVRVAHSPPSPAMLDICDRLGMLVYEEFSDMWDVQKLADDYHLHFAEWWRRDLSGMVLRDRNHPSIIIWSIGNEIMTDPNGYGPRLAALVRSLDATRPIAQGGQNIGPKGNGADPWSYVDVGDYHGAPPPADRAAHPDKAFLQSEDTSPEIYNDWKLARDNPWYVGSWVWSGWDYIGESGGGETIVAHTKEEAAMLGIGGILGRAPYPWFNSFMSDIDLIGQRKPQNYLRAVVNGLSPLEMMVERPTPAGTQQYNVWYCYYDELGSWTWDVPVGQPMNVHIYTAGDSVTLTLNGRPVETKAVAEGDKRMASFSVPYAPGELVAVASLGGRPIGRKTLTTTGAPAAVRLTSDVASLTTGRDDLAHVLVEVVDDHDRLVPDAVIRVAFAVEGAGELVGAANGNPHNVDSFKRPRHWTWHGQALAILRPAKQPGRLMLTAVAPGLQTAHLMLPVAVERRTRETS